MGGDDNNISEPLMRVAAGTIPCKYPTSTSVIIELTWADKNVKRSRQSLLPLINHESAVLHACFWKGNTTPQPPPPPPHTVLTVFMKTISVPLCAEKFQHDTMTKSLSPQPPTPSCVQLFTWTEGQLEQTSWSVRVHKEISEDYFCNFRFDALFIILWMAEAKSGKDLRSLAEI